MGKSMKAIELDGVGAALKKDCRWHSSTPGAQSVHPCTTAAPHRNRALRAAAKMPGKSRRQCARIAGCHTDRRVWAECYLAISRLL